MLHFLFFFEGFPNLKHVLSEELLILLPVFPVNSCTEGGEVNVSSPGYLVGQVEDLLLQGVQAQTFQGRVEILKNGKL